MGFEQILDQTLTQNASRIKIVRKELKKCAKGYLLEMRRSSGKAYLSQVYYEGNQKVRKGITSKPEIVCDLLRKRLLEKELDCLEKNRAALKSCRDALRPFDLDKECKNLLGKYHSLDMSSLQKALQPGDVTDWEKDYERSDYRTEFLRIVTSRGLLVRSKSEALIAEKLYEYRISFRYEEVLYTDDGILVPDFTIMRSDGKIFIWEHCGLMSNEAYRKRQKRKIEMYEAMGFVPWDNLIITYDGPDGLVDVRAIESEIRNKLCL